MPTITLRQLAYARSGDKGANANIGIIAYTSQAHTFLQENLTVSCVADFFYRYRPGHVVHYEPPQLKAFSFSLYGILEGDGSRSLRVDAQGRALRQALL